MPNKKIDQLIWLALTDASFCERLLHEQRHEVLDLVSLNEDERQAVLSVQADTLEAFAGAFC
jgi:hypothetical protein